MVLRFCFWLRKECDKRSEYDDSHQMNSSEVVLNTKR